MLSKVLYNIHFIHGLWVCICKYFVYNYSVKKNLKIKTTFTTTIKVLNYYISHFFKHLHLVNGYFENE